MYITQSKNVPPFLPNPYAHKPPHFSPNLKEQISLSLGTNWDMLGKCPCDVGHIMKTSLQKGKGMETNTTKLLGLCPVKVFNVKLHQGPDMFAKNSAVVLEHGILCLVTNPNYDSRDQLC